MLCFFVVILSKSAYMGLIKEEKRETRISFSPTIMVNTYFCSGSMFLICLKLFVSHLPKIVLISNVDYTCSLHFAGPL